MTTNFVAIEQYGHPHGTIYGVGEDTDQAVEDAAEWLSEDDLDAVDWSEKRIVGELRIVMCTPALAAAVKEHGGSIEYTEMPDGALCLPSEAA